MFAVAQAPASVLAHRQLLLVAAALNIVEPDTAGAASEFVQSLRNAACQRRSLPQTCITVPLRSLPLLSRAGTIPVITATCARQIHVDGRPDTPRRDEQDSQATNTQHGRWCA